MDQFEEVIYRELLSNIDEETKLIEKLLKCQTYKQFLEEKIDLDSDVARGIFKSATLTYTSALEVREAARRLPAIISEAEFI